MLHGGVWTWTEDFCLEGPIWTPVWNTGCSRVRDGRHNADTTLTPPTKHTGYAASRDGRCTGLDLSTGPPLGQTGSAGTGTGWTVGDCTHLRNPAGCRQLLFLKPSLWVWEQGSRNAVSTRPLPVCLPVPSAFTRLAALSKYTGELQKVSTLSHFTVLWSMCISVRDIFLSLIVLN